MHAEKEEKMTSTDLQRATPDRNDVDVDIQTDTYIHTYTYIHDDSGGSGR
jgi:hypothetical protein